MAIVNATTNETLTFRQMTERRIIYLQRSIQMAMAQGKPSAVASLDRQLAGAMVSLRREDRRLAALGRN